jgi:hypothetical protein
MNPHPGTGSRNLFCSSYSKCLNYAAQRYWRNFYCPVGCEGRRTLVLPDVINERGEHVISPELLRRGRTSFE